MFLTPRSCFRWLAAGIGLTLNASFAAPPAPLLSFQKKQLNNEFWSEGASSGDFNKDGKMDVVSGPYWWEGPDYGKRHEYYPATKTSTIKDETGKDKTIAGFKGALSKENDYSDNFLAFSHDLNADGWTDILILGFPGKEGVWYENPQGKEGAWKKHVAIDVVDNESPAFGDLTGDGKPEIICMSGGFVGYAEPDWAHPDQKWKFRAISEKGPYERFTHGLGYGDINGDGKMDMMDRDGWWEQPASLAGDAPWKRNTFAFNNGGAQMYAYDVNGDGRNDVITSLEAHGYGLAWFEQKAENGAITFTKHLIMGKTPGENPHGLVFSQLHAVDLIDMDGDGLKDIITGKRFWAHGPTVDAEPDKPAVLYWFKLSRTGPEKKVEFTPSLIDDDSGIGTQVVASDLNGDKRPDVVVGNKKGTFVHLQQGK